MTLTRHAARRRLQHLHRLCVETPSKRVHKSDSKPVHKPVHKSDGPLYGEFKREQVLLLTIAEQLDSDNTDGEWIHSWSKESTQKPHILWEFPPGAKFMCSGYTITDAEPDREDGDEAHRLGGALGRGPELDKPLPQAEHVEVAQRLHSLR